MHSDDWNRFATYIQAAVAARMNGDEAAWGQLYDEFDRRGARETLENFALEIVTPLMDAAKVTSEGQVKFTTGDPCFDKRLDGEESFTLLARDEIAPSAIRYWASERIRTGKNRHYDECIVDAEFIAGVMDAQRDKIRGLLTEVNRVSIEEMQLPDTEPAKG